MVLIKTGGAPAPSANDHLDGTDWDRCPVHGTEATPQFKIGAGKTAKGEEYLGGVIYNSDLRTGGCGDTWGRKTRQGVEDDHVHAPNSGAVTLTRGATRTLFDPGSSQAYQDNYECIFGHK